MIQALDLLWKQINQRNFIANYNRDVFLASFPRSGNTWLRAVIYHLIERSDPANLATLDYSVPDIHYSIKRKKVTNKTIYFVKTHEVFRHQFVKALYVVRDPVDTLESYYRYIRLGQPNMRLQKFAVDAALGRIWPSSWSEHVMSWSNLDRETYDKIHIVRYEDLLRQEMTAISSLTKCVQLIDPSINVAATRASLARFSIEKMKKLEAAGNRPSERTKGTNWFVGAARDEDAKGEIAEALRRHRPETVEIAAQLGYVIK